MNRECFEACCRQFGDFAGKIVVCFGDFRQTSPIVKDGTISESIDACIQSSEFWPGVDSCNGHKKFVIEKLTINMRLEKLNRDLLARLESIDSEIALDETSAMRQEELGRLRLECVNDRDRQVAYAKMILQIGDGVQMYDQDEDPDIEMVDNDPRLCSSSLCISNLTTFTQIDREDITEDYLRSDPNFLTEQQIELLDECKLNPYEGKSIKTINELLDLKFMEFASHSKKIALDQMYPFGFDAEAMQKRTILATTNDQVKYICIYILIVIHNIHGMQIYLYKNMYYIIIFIL